MPEMTVGIYDRALFVDHQRERAWFVHHGFGWHCTEQGSGRDCSATAADARTTSFELCADVRGLPRDEFCRTRCIIYAIQALPARPRCAPQPGDSRYQVRRRRRYCWGFVQTRSGVSGMFKQIEKLSLARQMWMQAGLDCTDALDRARVGSRPGARFRILRPSSGPSRASQARLLWRHPVAALLDSEWKCWSMA